MDVLLEIIIGFVVGVAIGLTGVGGGVLILPSLIYILKIPPVPAVGTGLAYGVISRTVGTISHFTLNTVRLRRSLYFLPGGILGVLVVSKVMNNLVKIHNSESVNSTLQIVLGVVVLITALGMIYQMLLVDGEERNNRIEESRRLPIPLRQKILGVFFGIIIGCLIGATSVGGGVLIIPLFMLFFHSSCKEAVGSSIFISLFLSLVGSIVYLIHGNVMILTTLFLCLGALPGVILGSKLTTKIPEAVMFSIVAVVVAISGIAMFF